MKLGTFLVDRRPLAFPAFRRLWTASVVVAVSGSFSVVAVPVQLFALTGSSATVGLAAGVSLATLAASATYSGALADTLDRRVLLLVGHTLLVLTYLGLWGQVVLSLNSVSVVLALLLGQGAGLGATLTTAGAVVPRLVPGEVLVAANGLSSLARYAGAVVGPLLAGALIPLVGLGPLYLLDAVAMTAMLWAVARLPALPAPARSAARGGADLVLLGGPQLANVAHGVGSALVGPRWAIGLGGALAATTVVALLRLVPQLWRYLPPEQSTAVPAAESDVDGRASSR